MQITQAFPVKVPLDSADHAKVMEEVNKKPINVEILKKKVLFLHFTLLRF